MQCIALQCNGVAADRESENKKGRKQNMAEIFWVTLMNVSARNQFREVLTKSGKKNSTGWTKGVNGYEDLLNSYSNCNIRQQFSSTLSAV